MPLPLSSSSLSSVYTYLGSSTPHNALPILNRLVSHHGPLSLLLSLRSLVWVFLCVFDWVK